MEYQLDATLTIDLENINKQLSKVISAMKFLELAVDELQSTLSKNGIEVTLRERVGSLKART